MRLQIFGVSPARGLIVTPEGHDVTTLLAMLIPSDVLNVLLRSEHFANGDSQLIAHDHLSQQSRAAMQ